jgi:hypothetical protein
MQYLQEVDLIVDSDADCDEILNGYTHPSTNICAGVPEGGKGPCNVNAMK